MKPVGAAVESGASRTRIIRVGPRLMGDVIRGLARAVSRALHAMLGSDQAGVAQERARAKSCDMV